MHHFSEVVKETIAVVVLSFLCAFAAHATNRRSNVTKRVMSGRTRVLRRVMTNVNAKKMMRKVIINAVKISVGLNRMVGKKREILSINYLQSCHVSQRFLS